MNPEFRHTLFIARPAADLWSALTEKTVIDPYYLVPAKTLELWKGGKTGFGGEAEVITGTILKLEAPGSLVHTFRQPEVARTGKISPEDVRVKRSGARKRGDRG
jgi:uncharacterized protein YndB with AHSA1/START domain